MQVNMFEAKTNLSRLVGLLEEETEKEIIIARNGVPVAKLVRYSSGGKRKIGAAAGAFVCPENINDGDAEIAAMFEAEK